MKAKKILAMVLALVTAMAVIPFTTTAIAVKPISSADQLVELMSTPAMWDGAYYLTADIDLTGKTQSPIGNSETAFTGYFDGMGHSITGLNITGDDYLGLFGCVNNATVKNVSVSGSVVSEYAPSSGATRVLVGGAIGAVTGNSDIVNVSSTATVSALRQAVGGCIGSVFNSGNDTVNIIACSYNGTVTGLRGVGGLIGIVSAGGTVSTGNAAGGIINISGCSADGTVIYSSTTGAAQCGGLIGSLLFDNGDNFEINVVNCVNGATITPEEGIAVSNTVGGIVGFVNANTSDTSVVSVGGTVNFIGCVNNGSITAAQYAGGIAALVAPKNLSNYNFNFIACANNGTVYASSIYAGGIVAGCAGGKVVFERCRNNGNVSAEMYKINSNRSYAAGILGYASLDTGVDLKVDITNCENAGTIQGIARNVGGIAGGLITKGTYTITNCRNTGSVTGLIAGGIIGWTASSTSCTVSNCLNVGQIRNYSTAGGSVGSIFGYPQSNATVIDNYYLSGSAFDLSGTEQFGRGATSNGKSTADDSSAYVGLGSENINTSLSVNGLNGTPSSGAWVKGTTYPELTALKNTAEEATVTEIYGISLSVGTDLSFNAIVTLAENVDPADTKVVFTYADDTYEAEAVENGLMYKYTLKAIAPQAMTELITARLYVNDVLVDTAKQSVRGYCEMLIDDASNSDAVIQLAKDILAYGAAAQEYRSYNLDSLANVDITGATEFTQLDYSVYAASSVAGTPVEGVKFNGVGVRFDYTNKVFFTFTAPSVDGITVIVNGNEAEILPYDSSYIVYSDDIFATNYGDEVVAVLKAGDTVVQTVTYSVASFVYEMQNDMDGEELSDAAKLARALYNYGLSAIEASN